MLPKNTLKYHSTKDADFKEHQARLKVSEPRSFVEDEKKGTAHLVDKEPIGEGAFGSVRKVPTKEMVIKEMKIKSHFAEDLSIKEHEMGKEVFTYSLFQSVKEDSIVRIGIPFYKGSPLYQFTRNIKNFHLLCTLVIMIFDEVDLFEECKESTLCIVHGDLNSKNILVEGNSRGEPQKIRIIDLGFTRKEGDDTPGLWGEDMYLAPELELITKAALPQDVFSLGALVWPFGIQTYSIFSQKNFSDCLVKNIQFIQNQMTYCDPVSRINIATAKDFFIKLRYLEPLLLALNNYDEKQIEKILKKNELDMNEVIAFTLRGECDEEALSLLEKYSGISDFDSKVMAEKEKITQANILYVGQWLLYYSERADLKAVKKFCAKWDKTIIKTVLETYQIYNRPLIEETMILSKQCFIYLLNSFHPDCSGTFLIKLFSLAANDRISLPTSLQSDFKIAAVKSRMNLTLTLSSDLKLHLDSFNKDGQTLAHHAAHSGDLTVLKELIELKPKLLFAEDRKGETPLHLAVKAGQIHVLEFFKASSALQCVNHYQETMAHIAVRYRRLDLFKFLLKVHSDFQKACARDGKTLAHLAAMVGECEILQLFSKHDILELPDGDGNTPLHCAVISEQKEAVALLIKEKSSLLVYNRRGEMAIHLAATLNETTILEMLVAVDSDLIHAKSLRRNTPIEFAIGKGAIKVFEYLLKNCVDKNTVVHAVIKGNSPRMLRMLSEYKVDLNYPDRAKLTPLQNAIELNKGEMVKTLLKLKADPNYSHDKKTALDFAVEAKKPNFKIIDRLLQAGANADSYIKSNKITPVVAFILLVKLKMRIDNEPQETISLHLRSKLSKWLDKDYSENWMKCLEEIIKVDSSSGKQYGLFSSQQMASKFNFSSIASLKEFLRESSEQESLCLIQ